MFRKLSTFPTAFLVAIFVAVTTVMPVSAQHTRPAKPVVSVLGDSYSTFEGYIPLGHAVWYTKRSDTKRTDVDDVKQTWWWQLISRGGYILGQNDSYSGATISYRGYRGEDYSSCQHRPVSVC